MSLNPGETINNRYRIVKILGQGGFGAVYRAWDTSFNMPCALKENLETTPQAQRQFKREARLLRTMKHANLPLVTDYFILPGKGQYLVMDYIEGQDIEHMIEDSGGPLPAGQVINWSSQICDALEYLHAQKPPIIHRDIKPANIRITPQGQAILVDFGIAKVYDPTLETTTGARAFTPGYAPVEQYGQGKTDARTDIYALGATIYTMLTGERPVESIQRTLQDNLTPVDQLNPSLPPHLAKIVSKSMHMDPNQRFGNAGEFKRALLAHAQGLKREDEDIPDTVVAPIPEMAYPFVQRAASAAQPAKDQQTATSKLRWGVLSGVGLLILLVGLFVISVSAAIIYTQFIKGGSTPTLPGQATSLPGEKLPQSTITPSVTKPPLTAETLPTSTLFAPVEKPPDIPVMPGAEQLKVSQMESEGNTVLFVTFMVDEPSDAIVAYYESEMPTNGWTKATTYADGDNLILYFQKGQRLATMAISKISGQLWVNISLMNK